MDDEPKSRRLTGLDPSVIRLLDARRNSCLPSRPAEPKSFASDEVATNHPPAEVN